MDFTPAAYTRLLEALQAAEYASQTITGFIDNPTCKAVLFRHDVDLLPKNALAMAKLEHELGIVSTYYFRAVPESWDEGIIRQIYQLRHEIGYHYESLSSCRGDFSKAFADFKANLGSLRELVPVKTTCMHGSPLSGIDNLDLLRNYDYKSLGLVAEPYLDLDFDQIFYLTDTGRRWDGWKVSVRDKMLQQEKWVQQGLVFHTTWDIIRATERGKLPDKVMMTVHPQRWTDNPVEWVKELVWQNVKNVIKALMVRRVSSAG